MNALRFLPLAALFFTCSLAQGQVIILTGHVTSVTGNYVGEFSGGDSVKLSFDFTGRLVDIFNGAFPGQAFYQVTASLSVNNKVIPISQDFPSLPNAAAVIYNRSDKEGLSGFTNWYDSGGWYDSGSSTWQPSSNREFRQSLLLGDSYSFLTSVKEFPSGIPISNFVNTEGYYSREYRYLFGDIPVPTGRINWEITSYEGFPDTQPPVLSPVPEPSVYGLGASLLLGGMVARKRFRGVQTS